MAVKAKARAVAYLDIKKVLQRAYYTKKEEEWKMLQGKVAVVTGGTRGIGLAIVRTYLQNGAKVCLFGSRQETADKAVAELVAENANYQVMGLAPDLTDMAAVEKAFAAVNQAYGAIDILGNNAGISAREPLDNYTAEAFQNIMDLNVNAVFYCTKVAVEYMKKQGSGVVINTSSMVSLYGQPAGCGYPASKFALNGLTKSLARELGPHNIRVNAVAPGVIHTDMVDALPSETVDMITKNIPLRRMGEPEDIANAFLFLASNLASYVTGEILSVDGATMV